MEDYSNRTEYRDRLGVYWYFKDNPIYADISNGYDKIWMLYNNEAQQWRWSVTRVHSSVDACYPETLADRQLIKQVALYYFIPMRSETLKSVIERYVNMSKYSNEVISILENEIEKSGYDYDSYFWYVDNDRNVKKIIEQLLE